MIFRTKRGAGGYQDGLLGGIQLARTRRRSSICQDKTRRLFRTAYWGGDSAGQDKAAAQAAFRTKRR